MQGPLAGEPQSDETVNDRFIVHRRELDFKKGISRGSCGTIYRGLLRYTDVTIKKAMSNTTADKPDHVMSSKKSESEPDSNETFRTGIPDFHESSQNHERCLKREAQILMSVRHPNIVLFMGLCLQPVCLVTEWCSRGSLKNIIRRSQMAQPHNSDGPCHQNLPWAIRLMMAIDIAKGMVLLHTHSKKIVHGHLSTANVLVDAGWKCKIADFGLSIMEGLSETTCSAVPIDPAILAPEVLGGQLRSTASDVYAFGFILLELYSLQPAWPGLDHQQIGSIVLGKGERPVIPDIPAGIANDECGSMCIGDFILLIKHCWSQNPGERPTFDTITKTLSLILHSAPENFLVSRECLQTTGVPEVGQIGGNATHHSQLQPRLAAKPTSAVTTAVAGPPSAQYYRSVSEGHITGSSSDSHQLSDPFGHRSMSEGHLPTRHSAQQPLSPRCHQANRSGSLPFAPMSQHQRLPAAQERASGDDLHNMWIKAASNHNWGQATASLPAPKPIGEIQHNLKSSPDGRPHRRLPHTFSLGNLSSLDGAPQLHGWCASQSPRTRSVDEDSRTNRSIQGVIADLRLAHRAEAPASLCQATCSAPSSGSNAQALHSTAIQGWQAHCADASSPGLQAWRTEVETVVTQPGQSSSRALPNEWLEHPFLIGVLEERITKKREPTGGT
eukprot:jgi/Botrbrau1/23032/Bobra.136_1s0022.2